MILYNISYSLLSRLFPAVLWKVSTSAKELYLTFDDGPQETATAFVLDTLNEFGAKATFFCVGENVKRNQAMFSRILDEGHSVGNHTMHHMNAWKVRTNVYFNDVMEADSLIGSALFRPPYGKLGLSHYFELKKRYRIVMWDVLTWDFKTGISADDCFKNGVSKTKPGSIIVFHDSMKCLPVLRTVLPDLLRHFSRLGYSFRAIPCDRT